MDSDQLYGLPLDRFIAERGALVKALRADGEREQAAEVAALRKPSVAAWAVNQLVRTQRRAVDDLFSAGDALRDVQAEVMAGRQDAQSLRDAAGDERAAVDALIASARGLLTSAGDELGPAVIDRVADTLHAAALDDEARAEVDEGRLERELRHIGLGAGGLAPAASPAKRAGRKHSQGADASGAKSSPKAETRTKAAPNNTKTRTESDAGSSKRRAADLKRAERERVDTRRAARSTEADARREADRAARALRIAQERRERAVQALADADEELSEATSTAEAALEAHHRARDQLDAL